MLSHRRSSGANAEQRERAVRSQRGEERSGGRLQRSAGEREMINDDHRDDGPRWLVKLTEA